MLETIRTGSLSWLSSVKMETFLIVISGIMALITSVTSHRNTHTQKYRLLVIGSSDSDVIGFSCISLAVIGLFSLSIGVFKTARKCTISTNQYIAVVVVLLIGNFVVGVYLTEYKSRVIHGLETSMMQQLKESVDTKIRFGVGFTSAEAWDTMQSKMLCCGVNSYKDYLQLGRISVDQNTGCYGPLSRWLVRVLNKMTAMVFATVCIQALSVFYMVWLVYRRSFMSSATARQVRP